MESLVRHLHEWAREIDITPEEWLEGIKFLTAVGHNVTTITARNSSCCRTHWASARWSTRCMTAAQREGHADQSAGSVLPSGFAADGARAIASCRAHAQQIVIYGKVTDVDGKGIPNASVEIWQTDEDGVYDLQAQYGAEVPAMDMRGQFRTDANGNYYMRTVLPLGYMIPMDGPGSDMIRAQKRHGYRPSHIHFLVGAPGYRELVTALYAQGDEHIDSDTVFGVTDSLVVQVDKNDPNSPMAGYPSVHYEFKLALAAKEGTGRVGADPSQITKPLDQTRTSSAFSLPDFCSAAFHQLQSL